MEHLMLIFSIFLAARMALGRDEFKEIIMELYTFLVEATCLVVSFVLWLYS